MSDDPDIDQSTLWCEARKDKDGNVSTDEPGLEDKLSEIVSYLLYLDRISVYLFYFFIIFIQ